MDALSDEVADGTLRLTTRQECSSTGWAKAGLIPLVRALNERLVTTLGACGDVVRNTMCCPAPMADDRQAQLLPADASWRSGSARRRTRSPRCGSTV
jgi:sulfite reductase (ferredoxin)